MLCLFLSSDAPAELALPQCLKALDHRPARAVDPYLDDGPPPARVLQLYFDALPSLEAAAARLQGPWRAEAMAVHGYAVPDATIRTGDGGYCTYLVAYAGPAEDEARWHEAYFARHPRLMAQLPAIRELEVYTPIEWRSPQGLARVRHLQRNKVAFDNPAALSAALASPVRREMRAHYAQLPAFSGAVAHYAMSTSPL